MAKIIKLPRARLLSRFVILVFLSLIYSAAISKAVVYYVSNDPSAGDGNAGTDPTAPLFHIQKAINKAAYGDTINVKAGTYREQVYATNVSGLGGPGNMLTIQAWDTDNDGVIEPSERPTILASQQITSWTAMNDPRLWTELAGTAPFQENTIFYTHLDVLPSGQTQREDDTIHLVMEFPTSSLQQTRWTPPSTLLCGGAGSSPQGLYSPYYMAAGSFLYDTGLRTLYIWTSDGHIPGTQYPVEAVMPTFKYINGLDSDPTHGNYGPLFFGFDYIHINGLILRYSNGTSLGVSGVAVRHNCIIENCDIQWMDAQGVSCYSSKVTNCTISNNGKVGVNDPEAYATITGCTLENNNFRQWTCEASAIMLKVGGDGHGAKISGNTVVNNLAPAIWVDTEAATVQEPGEISGNFLSGNEAGIVLEGSSLFRVFNNIVANSTDIGIAVAGSSLNTIVHNTVAEPFIANSTTRVPFTLYSDPKRTDLRATNNIIAYNIFVTSSDQAIMAIFKDCSDTNIIATPVVYNNTYKYNLVYNFLAPSSLMYPPLQLNCFFPPSYNNPYPYTDVQSFFTAVSESGNDNGNQGNFGANPVFDDTVVSDPTDPVYYNIRWDSPAKDGALPEFSVLQDYSGAIRDAFPDLGANEVHDFDGDGIADSWERYYVGNLTLLGSGDYDSDGVSDLNEYRRGTSPIDASSKTVTIYASEGLGSDSFDGLSSAPVSHTRGPKQTIHAAINSSLAGDAVWVETGTYQEGNIDISSAPISVVIQGTVTIN